MTPEMADVRNAKQLKSMTPIGRPNITVGTNLRHTFTKASRKEAAH
jgi:hypothetical protein